MRGFARTLKKKSTEIFQKAGMFFATELDGVSSHTFTTNPPRFTTHFTAFCTPKIARLPAKTPFHYAKKNLSKFRCCATVSIDLRSATRQITSIRE
jgi:hypothetical protein